MKSLAKWSVAIIAVLALLIWGISSFLSVDDLAKCDEMPSTKTGCYVADAVVAVSGGDTQARTQEAINLYQNGWGRLIIFSGAAADKSGPSNADVMKQQAIDAGIDPNVIIAERYSETTLENAAETSSIFKQHNVKSAILVTSGYHMRRAGLEFNRRALGVELRSHAVSSDRQWGPFWWLSPQGWSLAIPETIRSLILSVGGVDKR